MMKITDMVSIVASVIVTDCQLSIDLKLPL